MGSIFQIILQRLALGVITLLIVSMVIFVAVNALPGDFAQAILGQSATDESRKHCHRSDRAQGGHRCENAHGGARYAPERDRRDGVGGADRRGETRRTGLDRA